MLDAEGTISFVAPIMSLIDGFLADYERLKGPLRTDLERGLAISYLLGVMHEDLEAIWDSLGQSPVFGTLHPRTVFEECVKEDKTLLEAQRASIIAELRKRRWVPFSEP